MKTVGERLKALREDNDLTQTKLSKELQLSRTAISSYEIDNATPSLEVLIKYADYFNVSTDYILGRVKDPNLKIKDNGIIQITTKKEADDTIINEFLEEALRFYNKKKLKKKCD